MDKDLRTQTEPTAGGSHADTGQAGPPQPRRLCRTREGRMIAGVCSGLGDYLGVDANVLRLLLALFVLLGGSGVALYILGWVLIPEEGKGTSVLQDFIDRNRDNPAVQDVIGKAKEGLHKVTSKR
ncbi:MULTISPECIES: PspC domain-containing protein [Thermomonospora]|uniref:Phage shock protein C, PspC n=1 Tax=Thermomonospora curvata (strain ATCC 19995 / DSM 43183 / JCM 3096 / KCTC 9072 / NBRC 15933 / NCIMB 10081 / Henssen B9) TaxID=471852 RepID=D1A3L4_THECD|nr:MULTISPECIES: PspC domain-containing protein [Thermomonospora]ACY96139.1 phage shock protein C, PspC [Thermomonospora curvata DSM 43183]PKK15993.1 MAG: PspC domain-containing protein [Thermomonospora sp. CIF 1]